MRPTFKLILFAREVKDGKRPVMFRVTFNRKSKHFSLSRYALPDEWDEKSNRFRRPFPEYKRENELLRTLEQRAADILFAWERENKAFDFAEFERLMFADRAGKKNLIAWQYVEGIAAALGQFPHLIGGYFQEVGGLFYVHRRFNRLRLQCLAKFGVFKPQTSCL